MRSRLVSLALLFGLVSTALAVPLSASAQVPGPGQGQGQGRTNASGQNKGNTFPVTGTGTVRTVPVADTPTPAEFVGTFVVQEFKQLNGKLVAHGVLNGKVTTAGGAGPSADVVDKTVDLPVQKINDKTFASDPVSDLAQEADLTIAQVGSCDILNLILGPLHLDLLGLVVNLNQVILDITGETGAGNLLGNLLCALTGILDSNAALGPIINLLNAILAVLNLNL